jgi:uncharacterized membrane protein
MNKNDFMRQLADGLKKLPKDEVSDILSDFEEYFSCASKEGREEHELCERLGDPKKLAKEYTAQRFIENANEKRSAKTMTKAFFGAAGLGILNFLYVMFVVVVGYIVIASFYIAVCCIGLSGLAVVVCSIAFQGAAGIIAAWFGIFTGLALTALSVLAFIGLMQLGKLFRRGNMAFLNGTSEKIKRGNLNE